MPRYIDAEPYEGMQIGKVIDVIIKANKNIGFGDIHGQDFVTVEQIDNIPTADVQEVKHGHWIGADGRLVCSECGHRMKDTVLEPIGDGKFRSVKPYYCGKCGAYMGGDDKCQST